MPEKRAVIGVLAGLACAGWIASCVLRQNAFAASQVEFIGSFDLRREISGLGPQAHLRLSKMLASSGRLYSLVFAGRGDGRMAGLIASRAVAGSGVSVISVPEGTSDFTLTSAGHIVVHAVDRRSGQASLREVDPWTGTVVQSVTLPAPLVAIWSTAQGVGGVGWDGRIYRVDEVRQSTETMGVCRQCAGGQPPPSVEVHRLSEDRLAIVWQETAEIDLVNAVTGSARSVRVAAPEAEVARARYLAIRESWERQAGRDTTAQLARGLVVFPSAADERGRLYLAIGAHDYTQGRPVVVLDENGTLLGTLRIPEWRVPSEKRFTMVTLALGEGLLFAGDRTGLVAVFRIS